MSAHRPLRVAVLGGGTGTNARALIAFSQETSAAYSVELVISSRADSGLVRVAQDAGVPCYVLSTADWQADLLQVVEKHDIEVLALAGFLRHVPTAVISAMNGRVVNIHPALLPNFGGKGMYGIHVHRAVINAGSSVTGATVHIVTENYDEGAILAQSSLDVDPGDTAEQLQERVKSLEHRLYPETLDLYARTVQNGAMQAG